MLNNYCTGEQYTHFSFNILVILKIGLIVNVMTTLTN